MRLHFRYERKREITIKMLNAECKMQSVTLLRPLDKRRSPSMWQGGEGVGTALAKARGNDTEPNRVFSCF